MFGNLQGWHLIVVLVVILLLFGAPKLPGLAKSLGQSMRIFRGEVKQMKEENAPAPEPVVPTPAQSTQAPATAEPTTDPAGDATKPGS